MYKSLVVVILAMYIFSACGGGNNEEEVVTQNVSILTISGSIVMLSGTFLSDCFSEDGGTTSRIVTQVMSGNHITLSAGIFNGANCSGSVVDTDSNELSISDTGNTATTTGWLNTDGAIASPPYAADSSGPLGNNETVTLIKFTALTTGLGNTAGESGNGFFVYDDTGTSAILYWVSPHNNTALELVPYIEQ